MIKTKKRIDLLSIVTGFLLLLALQPYFVWGFSNYMMLLVLIAPIAPMAYKLDINKEKHLFLLFFFILFSNAIIHNFNFVYIIYLLMFVFIPFCQKDYANNTFDAFRNVIAIIFAFSLIEYLYVVLLGRELPGYILSPLNELKQYDYTVYPPLLVVSNTFLETIRFLAVFDEPGVVGTVSMLILFVEDYKLKNICNIIVFIAGIFSFSFFFYVATLLYWGIRYGKNNIRYILFFFVASCVFYVATKDNPVLDELVYSRFEYDKDKGTLAGINRSSDKLDSYYDKIKGTWGYFWGVDVENLDDYGSTSSYKTEVLRYGMVFCVLYVVFFMFLARHRRLSLTDFLLLSVMILGTLYQRPRFFDVVFVYLFSQFIVAHARFINGKSVDRLSIK